MKIFVFSTDDKGLEAFATKEDAINFCEGIDVENGEYLFWDEFGINMEPKFSKLNQKNCVSIVSGEYDLVPFPIGLDLIDFLSNVSYVEGHGMFKDVDDIRQHLTRASK